MRQTWATLGICAAAVSLAAGCSSARKDEALATNIKAAMFSDAQLKNAEIDVSVTRGVATLKGNVADGALRVEAEKVASQAGAKMVDDEIAIQAAENAAPAPPTVTSATTTEPKATVNKPAPTPKVQKTKSKEPATIESAADVTPEPPATDATNTSASSQNNSPTSAPAPEPTQATPAPAPTPVAAQAAPPPPASEPKEIQVPSGMTITVRMIDGVDSSVNHTGEIFHASLDTPMIVDNNVIVPRGADVYIRLTSASQSGTMRGKSELHLELVKMDFQGRSYSLVSSTYSLAGKPRGQETAKKVGGGAVIGTLIGAIAGGGRGAAIGAAVGAAGGGVYASSGKPQQLKVPAETRLDFQLEGPVSITVQPHVENAGTDKATNLPQPPPQSQ